MRYDTQELIKKIDGLGLTDAQAGAIAGVKGVTVCRARMTGRLSQKSAVALSEKFDVPLVPLRDSKRRPVVKGKTKQHEAA